MILTGLSGSGKSTALHALEDSGYFAIDNLPGEFLPKLFRDLAQPRKYKNYNRLALVMDAREGEFIRHLKSYVETLHEAPFPIRILFLIARDDVLIRRFSETRRRHPLSPRGTILQGIRKEKQLLQPLRALSTHVLDTSDTNVHDLRSRVLRLLKVPGRLSGLVIQLLSFGYRYGIPMEADMVIDVRFLPNPYFIRGLRRFSGQNPKVRRFVLQKKASKRFLSAFLTLLRFLLKNYQREGRAYLTIAFGCTGGRHRSVVMVNTIAAHLKRWGYPVNRSHRDLVRRLEES